MVQILCISLWQTAAALEKPGVLLYRRIFFPRLVVNTLRL